MPVPLFQVDAFTGRSFAGNPAAVCLLEDPADATWMQAVASEKNLSETAFLVRRGESAWDLRWFTPAVEVDLCGHATLASAHVLWHEGVAPAGGDLVFSTRGGDLGASRRGAGIELDFPATPAREQQPPPDLLDALGVEAVCVATNGVDWLVEVDDEQAVRQVAPDFRRLATVACRGVMVTAAAEPGVAAHFVSRFFAPASGIDEDPVTGSAHCTLGPWWSDRLGRDALLGLQVSARGGEVTVRSDGDRVRLGGQAVTVLRGDLLA